MDRRTFLLGSGAALAAAACRPGRPGTRATPASRPEIVTIDIERVVGDDRLAFAIFDNDEPVRGKASGTLEVVAPDGTALPRVELRTFGAGRGSGGSAQPEGSADLVFVAAVPFTQAGFYRVRAKVKVDGRPIEVGTRVGVADVSRTVAVGGKAIEVPTPTVHDARGVDPICTRTPPCGMHEVSLDDALRSGKPVVVAFGTPALCESRRCGPVIDVIEAVRARSADVQFVHVEIYKDLQSHVTTSAVDAWHLDEVGEPFTFFVAADGTVKARLSAALGDFEVEAGIARAKA